MRLNFFKLCVFASRKTVLESKVAIITVHKSLILLYLINLRKYLRLTLEKG